MLSHLIVKGKDDEVFFLREKSLNSEGNIILRDILKLAIKDEKMTIIESTKKICHVIRENYRVDYCTILLNTPKGLSITASNIESKYLKHMEQYANKKLKEVLYQTNQEVDASIICGDSPLNYPTALYRGIRYFYFIPLKLGEKLLGALMIEDTSRQKMESLENDFFQIVLENIAIVLQNFIYKAKLVSAAMVDGLTQVWNRAYFDRYLINEIQKHKNLNTNLSLAIMDIDHFKRFNDKHGHLHGDNVLKRTSSYVKSRIREDKDIIARYGGEEFVIVFSGTTNIEITDMLDSIREEISQLYITNEENQVTPVTVSFGLAEFPRDEENCNDLIKKADEALYYSKENGRNIVTQYSQIA